MQSKLSDDNIVKRNTIFSLKTICYTILPYFSIRKVSAKILFFGLTYSLWTFVESFVIQKKQAVIAYGIIFSYQSQQKSRCKENDTPYWCQCTMIISEKCKSYYIQRIAIPKQTNVNYLHYAKYSILYSICIFNLDLG